jgi:hypothetical protein
LSSFVPYHHSFLRFPSPSLALSEDFQERHHSHNEAHKKKNLNLRKDQETLPRQTRREGRGNKKELRRAGYKGTNGKQGRKRKNERFMKEIYSDIHRKRMYFDLTKDKKIKI